MPRSVSSFLVSRTLAALAHIYDIDMPVADIKAIVSQINTQGKTLFITQEVVGGVASGPTGSLRPSDYSGIGYVTEYVVLSKGG